MISDDMLAEDGGKGDRIDFEEGMSCLPPVTIALIAANVAVFVWQVATGALASKEAIISAGALHRESVLAGEVWRVLSAMFLHGDAGHLIGNCVVLFIVGMACEHGLGVKRTIIVYMAAGVCGSLLSVALAPGPSVGASGAIFGVTGSVIVFLYRWQKLFFVRDKRIGFVLLIWALYQVGGGFLTPYIDNWAHIGGFAGGAVTTLFLKPRLTRHS